MFPAPRTTLDALGTTAAEVAGSQFANRLLRQHVLATLPINVDRVRGFVYHISVV